jgi:outer membrane immunogenic protein
MCRSLAVALAFAAAFTSLSARADGFGAPGAPVGSADFSGVNIGLDMGAAIGSSGNVDTSGFAFGGHLGYNLQNGPIVGGLEGDVLFSNASGGDQASGTFSTNSLDSIRARGGYAFGPILAYGTLGWAYSGTRYSSFDGAYDKSLTGYVFGAGAEYAVMRNISVRAELRRYEFGSANYTTPNGSASVTTGQTLLEVGVSGHF